MISEFGFQKIICVLILFVMNQSVDHMHPQNIFRVLRPSRLWLGRFLSSWIWGHHVPPTHCYLSIRNYMALLSVRQKS